jgi:transposase
MMKHTYRSVEVQLFDLGEIVRAAAPGSRVTVAIDVAKTKMVAAIADDKGQIWQSVKWQQPAQTADFLSMVCALQAGGLQVETVMEPTGTYGDPLRYQLQQRNIPVFLASPHFVRNMGIVYDGVPSKHDAKDAAVLAWLHHQNKTKLWPVIDETRRTLRALVDERELYSTPLRRTANKLEALLSRHFPELLLILNVQQQRSAWALLAALPSPAAMAAAPKQTQQILRAVSRGRISPLVISRVTTAAARSAGSPMTAAESRLIQRLANEMQRCAVQCDTVDDEIVEATDLPKWAALRELLGPVTLAVVIAYVGDPANYPSSQAFLKACGYNLREHSSGTKQGKLSLTKRGPGIVRKYLHLAGLRLILRSPQMKHWYQLRRQYVAGNKMAAVIAVVRKLAAALVHVARGARFDIHKLINTRLFPSLQIEPLDDAAMIPDQDITDPACLAAVT